MIGVSLSHGQDPWTSKQKTVHLSLHKVALHLHVGPQQQQAPGLHIEQRSKQHVTSAQQTIISPRHPILGGRTIAALQQQQPETSVSMLQHPIASEIRWSTRDPLVLPRVSETSAGRTLAHLLAKTGAAKNKFAKFERKYRTNNPGRLSERDEGHMDGQRGKADRWMHATLTSKLWTSLVFR